MTSGFQLWLAVVLMSCPFVATADDLKQRPANPVSYELGPGDELAVQVAKLDQFTGKTFRIDPTGLLHLPVAGDMKAEGLSIEDLQKAIADKLKDILRHPEVSVNVVSYHSQPVSIWGAVNQPGLHQLQGPSQLIEMISSAGGTRPDAGTHIRITRQTSSGSLPLPGATTDPSGQFTTATVDLDELTKGRHPEQNLYLRAHDVITVDRADVVYVIGEVKKAGGFTLATHEKLSILQAVGLAEGLTPAAAAKAIKILRLDAETDRRVEIKVNLKEVMNGKAQDVFLRAEDIVVVPNNVARNVTLRTTEAAIAIATGLVIFHP
jgi:polysaccharide biosynthesis/export protein